MIYKKGKKGLRLDLTLIAILQISAMFYGVHLLYAFRPVALILNQDEYISVTADVYDNYTQEIPPHAKPASMGLCGFNCFILSNSLEAVQSVVEAGVPARVIHRFYLDYSSNWTPGIKSVSLDDEARFTEENQKLVKEKFLMVAQEFDLKEQQLIILPARGRYLDGFVFVEKANGQILDFMVRPPTIE